MRRKSWAVKWVVTAALAAAFGAPAAANVVYTYTGNDFTVLAGPSFTANDSITAEVTLTNPLPASYAFGNEVYGLVSLEIEAVNSLTFAVLESITFVPADSALFAILLGTEIIEKSPSGVLLPLTTQSFYLFTWERATMRARLRMAPTSSSMKIWWVTAIT